jgi:RNA polymerase sigma factor (sigma-70 family)
MTNNRLGTILRHLRRVIHAPSEDKLSDRQLLARFAEHQDEAAFAALVGRHGPLVLGVGWRVLRHAQDAEDVLQATFLVLARRAGSMPWRESVANWLYEVAYRLAMKAKAEASRRRARENLAATQAQTEGPSIPSCRELETVLDEELQQMPVAYRLPLLLCYFQERTRDQAANDLRCSLRTLDRRLARGRELLRARLVRRGVTLSVALLAQRLASPTLLAGPSGPQLEAVVRAATAFATGSAAVGTIPTQVVMMAQNMERGAVMVKLIFSVVLVAGLVAAASALAWQRVGGRDAEMPVTDSSPGARPGNSAPAEPPRDTEAKEPAEPARQVTLRGRVTDVEGQPVAGAAVFLREQPTSVISSTWHATKTRNLARTTTDAQGHFAFPGVALPALDPWRRPGVALDVIVMAQGHGLVWKHVETLIPSGSIHLQLPRAGELRGQVVDAGGKPVAGVAVKVREIAQLDQEIRPPLQSSGYLHLQWAEVPLTAISDAQGRFLLSGLPRQARMTLVVDDPRFLAKDVYAATTNQPQPSLSHDGPSLRDRKPRVEPVHTGRVTLAVEPAARLLGRVILADTGKPALKARWAEPPSAGPPNRTVDAEGRFVLAQLPSGSFRISVYPPEDSPYLGLVAEVEIGTGQRDVEHTFALPPGVIVSGKVLDDQTGRGIAGAMIHYVPAKPTTTYPRARAWRTHTRADGSFRCAVPPGPGKLVLHGWVAGYQTPVWSGSLDDVAERFVRAIDVPADQAPPEVQFTLSRGLLTRGRALDPEGKPVAKARLHARRFTDNSSLAEPDQATDADGKFTLSGFNPEEQVLVMLWHPERRLAAQIQLSGGDAENKPVSRDVVLRPLGAVTGQVLDEGQKPLAGAVVHLWKEERGGYYSRVDQPLTVDANGHFTFHALVAGVRYLVGVEADGFAKVSSPSFVVEAGQTHRLAALNAPKTDQSITGTIVDPMGIPIAGIKVSGRLRRNRVHHESRVRITDGEGRFHLTDLPQGQVNLRAVVPGIVDRSFDLGSFPTGKQEIRIKLDTRHP